MVNVLSLSDGHAGKARLPGGVVWFSMVDNAPIRVTGTRNGVDRFGREGSNRAKQQRVVGTGLSGFEMGNSGFEGGSVGFGESISEKAPRGPVFSVQK